MSKTGCCPAVGEAGWNWGSAVQQQTWMETVFHGFYWKRRVKVTVATAKDYLGARSSAVEGSKNMEGGPLHKGVRPIARNLFGFPGYFYLWLLFGAFPWLQPPPGVPTGSDQHGEGNRGNTSEDGYHTGRCAGLGNEERCRAAYAGGRWVTQEGTGPSLHLEGLLKSPKVSLERIALLGA